VDALYSAVGGKWTTSRDLAEKIVDAVSQRLGIATLRCSTDRAALPGARFARFRDFVADQRHASVIPSLESLAHLYGSRLPLMLDEARNRPELLDPLGAHGDIGAQIVFAVREEMALTLSDAIMRRTGVGQFGPPPPSVLETAARLMAGELGWIEDHTAAEIAALAPWFETREAA